MNTLIKTGFIAAIALSSLGAHAEFISSDDWWLTTDRLGGLRESTTAPDFFFAVSRYTQWDPTSHYGNIDGYRIATTEEGLNAFKREQSGNTYTYFNQGGWNGYEWEGEIRRYFRFSDSSTTSAYKHAGDYDQYTLRYNNETEYLAGFVMIRDETARKNDLSDVSAPAVVFGAGLGLLMMGLRRRKG